MGRCKLAYWQARFADLTDYFSDKMAFNLNQDSLGRNHVSNSPEYEETHIHMSLFFNDKCKFESSDLLYNFLIWYILLIKI